MGIRFNSREDNDLPYPQKSHKFISENTTWGFLRLQFFNEEDLKPPSKLLVIYDQSICYLLLFNT